MRNMKAAILQVSSHLTIVLLGAVRQILDILLQGNIIHV